MFRKKLSVALKSLKLLSHKEIFKSFRKIFTINYKDFKASHIHNLMDVVMQYNKSESSKHLSNPFRKVEAHERHDLKKLLNITKDISKLPCNRTTINTASDNNNHCLVFIVVVCYCCCTTN